MSSRTKTSRLYRLWSLAVLAAAITAMVWFATGHRTELRQIFETLRDGLPITTQAEAAGQSAWLDSGPTTIDPQELASLDIEEQDRSDDDYERDEFGSSWLDVDENSCDTRNDILARDLVDVTYEDGADCEIADGTLHDPYTGTTIEGNLSEDVEIDHIVSLGDAWYSGAEQWSDEKRERFANDPSNLVAVDGPANTSKSDDSISEWYPHWDAPGDTVECRYAAAYVHVLAEYDLSVTRDDYTLLKQLEANCKELA
ncbi:HNH endonuclease family protein [Brachybacterium sacelli]|uniref:GmrSD restriction endonucleases C-terminal domain-containing protein n=2 Tax=Brachybacterium sacelli TaxID=173364 RepID=A0ABS4X5N1_9MICO|nr:HNH endonuclease family protein [Brachybacterium sacelli]MBP2383775.1 hypothetical protein [Brachybacterium sacelli]